MGRSPCGPTTPILTFLRVAAFPPIVRRRSRPFFTLAQSCRTVFPSVAAAAYRFRLALRQVAHSVQSHRLLHGAFSHRRCDSASGYGVAGTFCHRRIWRVDVVVSSRRSGNRRNALCLESAQLGNHDPKWSRTPQRKRNPVSTASESGS